MILQNFLLAFPLFFIIGLGYLSARTSLMTPDIGRGLTKFAFNIAIPCLLFITIRDASNFPVPDWKITVAYFGSCALVFLFSFFVGSRFLGLRNDESTIFSMGAIFSNNVQLGIPLVITLLGKQAIGSLALIVAVNVFLLWFVATACVEFFRSGGPSFSSTLREGLIRTLKNPVIAAICLGLLSSVFSVPVPEVLEKSLNLLASSATPVALFSVGVGLSQYKVSAYLKMTSAEVVFKLFLQPATVFMLCRVLNLGKIETQAACLLASLPVGVNVYIMSQEFGVVEGTTANALLITTTLSIFTVPVVLSIFGLL